jgi:hypothetical protein
MGLLDNVFGSGSGSAVPGGNVTKPLMIALLALLASRYMSGGSKEAPASARPDAPDSMPDPSPGTIIGGLGGLLKQFQQKGLGEVADSWIKTGPNDAARSDFGCTWSRRYRHPFPAHRPLQGSGRADSVPGSS